MGLGSWFQDRVIDPVKDAAQSTIDIVRGEADSEDWARVGGAAVGSPWVGGELGARAAQGMNPATPTVPGEDPRITALRERAVKDAQDFRENLPGYKQRQMRPEQMQANIAEREGRQAVKRGASRRGLLHSGIRQKGEAEVQSQKASTLAEARANINRQAEELADLKSDIAAGIGIADTGAMLSEQARVMEQARQEAANRRAAYSQIGQGLGYGAGALYQRGMFDGSGSTPITSSGFTGGGGLLTGSRPSMPGGGAGYLGGNYTFGSGG